MPLLGESGSDAGSGPPFNLMLPNFDDAEVDGELSGSPDSSTENRRPSHMGEGFAGLPQVGLKGACTCNSAAAQSGGRLKLQPARLGLCCFSMYGGNPDGIAACSLWDCY